MISKIYERAVNSCLVDFLDANLMMSSIGLDLVICFVNRCRFGGGNFLMLLIRVRRPLGFLGFSKAFEDVSHPK